MKKFATFVASFVILPLTAFACRDSEVNAPIHANIAVRQDFVARPNIAARYAQAQKKFGWAAQLHSQAMAEAIHERASWDRESHDFAVRNCALAKRITLKYAAIARTRAGMQAAAATDSIMVTEALTSRGCNPAFQMGIFVRPAFSSSLRALNAGSLDDELDVYGNAMVDAVDATNGSWSAIHNAALLSLDGAYDYVDEFDFNVLASETDFIFSSADTWYDYQQSGGFGVEQVQPTSVFRVYMWPGPGGGKCGADCRRTLRNDGIGFVAGALTADKAGGIEGAVFGGVVWGIASSLIT